MWAEDVAPASAAFLMERIRALSAPRAPRPAPVPPRPRRIAGARAVLLDVYNTMLACEPCPPVPAFRDACTAAGLVCTETAAENAITFCDAMIRADHASSRERGIACPEVDIRAVWRRVVARLFEGGLMTRLPNAAQIERLAVEYECRANPAWPVPQLEETLAELTRKGLVLGVVSNAQFYTPLALEALLGPQGARDRFELAACVWSYRVQEAKPSPRLVAEALRALATTHGIRPEETVCVGNDGEKDVLPALALGCRAVLCTADAGPEPPSPEGLERATAVTSSLAELCALL